MGPAMAGPGFGPFGGFGMPHPGPYGGFGGFGGIGGPGWGNQGWGNQGWGNPIPGQFGQGYGGFPTPVMGQSTAVPFGGVSRPAGSAGDKKQGAVDWHEMQKKSRGSRGGRKPQNNQRSKDQKEEKKEEKGLLAAKPAGIEKSVSKSAKRRAKAKAKAKAREEQFAQDALSGPADHHLLRVLTEAEDKVMGKARQVPAKDDITEDVAPPSEDAAPPAGNFDKFEDDLANIDAQALIKEAVDNPTGLQFPRDRERVERTAKLLEKFGQDRLPGLSETAAENGNSIISEALRQDLFNEQLADEEL